MDSHSTMMSKEEKKLYASIENVVNYINGKFIALPAKEIRRNNIILNEITDKIIERMKQTSPLFDALFKAKYYGGSYYDQLKVGNPNEYDLDLILTLPQMVNPVLKCSNRPGFVQVEVKAYENISQRPADKQMRFKELGTLLASNVFLSTAKVQSWFEGVFTKVYNSFQKEGKETYVDAILDQLKPEDAIRIYIKMIKGGPAFTLKIRGKEKDGSDIQMDIDFVPCFQFDGNKHWPKESGGYRPNPFSTKPSFLVVPKKPNDKTMDKSLLERYWRLSFQEQEREVIGKDKKVLKPSLKILKKLRDRCNHNIPSYFIKTIFLWTIDEEDAKFWWQPIGFVIITMLKKYEKYIREGKISYYWNKDYNLIEYLSESTTQGIANRLKKIISEVEIGLKDPIDPYVIGKSLLTAEEFEMLKLDVPLSKKQEKRIQNSITNRTLNTSHCFADTPDSTSPLLLLDFHQSDVARTQKYLDTYDKKQKICYEETAQIPEARRDSSESNAVIAYLQNVDEKLGKILDRVEESLEEGKRVRLILQRLEERITELEINNKSLRGSEQEIQLATIQKQDEMCAGCWRETLEHFLNIHFPGGTGEAVLSHGGQGFLEN